MTDPDPMVAEVRRIRDEYAAKFNYDLNAIFRDIKERERKSGRTYVSFADDATAIEQNQPVPPADPAIIVTDNNPTRTVMAFG